MNIRYRIRPGSLSFSCFQPHVKISLVCSSFVTYFLQFFSSLCLARNFGETFKQKMRFLIKPTHSTPNSTRTQTQFVLNTNTITKSVSLPELQGEGRRKSGGLHDDDGHRQGNVQCLRQGQTDPQDPPHQVRGAGRVHERRVPGGNQGAHAPRLHPGATGVCRRATHWGEFGASWGRDLAEIGAAALGRSHSVCRERGIPRPLGGELGRHRKIYGRGGGSIFAYPDPRVLVHGETGMVSLFPGRRGDDPRIHSRCLDWGRGRENARASILCRTFSQTIYSSKSRGTSAKIHALILQNVRREISVFHHFNNNQVSSNRNFGVAKPPSSSICKALSNEII